MLRSPITIALGHLFERLHNADVVDLLTRLRGVWDTSLESDARTNALCAAASDILATACVPDEQRDTLVCALAGNLEIRDERGAQPDTYAGVLRARAVAKKFTAN